MELNADDRGLRALRGPKNALDPRVPYGFFVERERGPDGALVDVATVLLTNRECPFTCLMCDLWVNTTDATVPAGAIAAQLDHALARLAPARAIKLYNAGSFFDAKAIPPGDWDAILERVRPFEQVIVEAHPALIGASALELARRLEGRLEVAMGLETAHPGVLARLNKRMTLDDFRSAAERLGAAGVPVRAFVLLRPPYLAEADGVHWALESVRFARACGVSVTVLIATRGGNGALERLAAQGDFAPPVLASLETALEQGVAEAARPDPAARVRSPQSMRVFADMWDAARLEGCAACRDARLARLRVMNDEQVVPAPVVCSACGAGSRDTGSHDAGSRDAGSDDRGSRDVGGAPRAS